MPFRIFICTMLLSVLLTSCAEWDADGVDFRNYLRDKHPYSKLDEADLNTWKSYVVNDTIKNEVWIYTSGRSESSVRGIRINYYISNLKGGEQCSKNGVKKEGESCTLNDNCIYPKCLE